jgi:hypothetical protein
MMPAGNVPGIQGALLVLYKLVQHWSKENNERCILQKHESERFAVLVQIVYTLPGHGL